jgi:hypothetical protein
MKYKWQADTKNRQHSCTVEVRLHWIWSFWLREFSVYCRGQFLKALSSGATSTTGGYFYSKLYCLIQARKCSRVYAAVTKEVQISSSLKRILASASLYMSLDNVVCFTSTSQFYSLNKFTFYRGDISPRSYPSTCRPVTTVENSTEVFSFVK